MKKVLLFLSVIITLIWFVPNGFSMVVTAEYTEIPPYKPGISPEDIIGSETDEQTCLNAGGMLNSTTGICMENTDGLVDNGSGGGGGGGGQTWGHDCTTSLAGGQYSQCYAALDWMNKYPNKTIYAAGCLCDSPPCKSGKTELCTFCSSDYPYMYILDQMKFHNYASVDGDGKVTINGDGVENCCSLYLYNGKTDTNNQTLLNENKIVYYACKESPTPMCHDNIPENKNSTGNSVYCQDSISKKQDCISEKDGTLQKYAYCYFTKENQAATYAGCDETASLYKPSLYYNPPSNNVLQPYYGPCSTGCSHKNGCVKWQQKSRESFCEHYTDEVNTGYLWIYDEENKNIARTDNDENTEDEMYCLQKSNHKWAKIKRVCYSDEQNEGYYTADYCIDTLKGTYSNENKCDDSPEDNPLYLCSCSDSDLTKADAQTLYGAVKLITDSKPCTIGCSEDNTGNCYKYKKESFECGNDDDAEVIEYKTLSDWEDERKVAVKTIENAKPCKLECSDEQMGYNDDDDPDNDDTSCYKYKEEEITAATCSTEFRTLAEWGITDTETQEKIKADTEIEPKDVCDLECKDGDDELTCKKYSQTVAKKHKKFVPCTDRISELAQKGYHSTYCPTSTTDCDIEDRKGDLNAQDFCLDEDALVKIYYGGQWYREKPDEYCATWTNGYVTDIQATTDTPITYTDSTGTKHNINKGNCECEGDGTFAYDYHPIQYWKEKVLKDDSVGQTRFDNTTEIDSKSTTGFCVADPFTNVSLNADLSAVPFEEGDKLYMSDSIKCKSEYTADNSSWCANGENQDFSFGWLDGELEKVSSDKEALCKLIFTNGDTSNNDFCDAEKLLSDYVTTNKGTTPNYKTYNGEIKYTSWLLSCESLKAEFNDAKIVDEAPSDSESITCYDKNGNEKYVPTCSKDYKKCDGHGQKEKEGSETCNFYDTPLYKECEDIGCATPSPNTIILKTPSNEDSIKQDFGPDIQITQCIGNGNGEALQVSCDSTIHTVKCEYPYVSYSPYNWCRIADNGNLDYNSPKVYSTDIKDSCKLLYSECGKELSKGEDRLSPKQALGTTSNVFMKVTDSISECHKKYGTAAQTEMCKENGSSRIRYNCYYIDDYTYTTENCGIGNDLTIPYILKNGVKHWNKCNCAPSYKYHHANCSKPSGNKCVQKEVTEEFLRDRNISKLPLGTKNVELYTSCNDSGTQTAVCSEEKWVGCYYCCPADMKVTGKIRKNNGKKEYQCVCK